MASTKSAEQIFRERLDAFLKLDDAPSQRKVASDAGIHYVHLNKIVRGHVVPGLDIADRVCRVIGSFLDEFIDDSFDVRQLISRKTTNRKKTA